jgi:rubrerythrin
MSRKGSAMSTSKDLEDQVTSWIHSAGEAFEQAESLSDIEDALEEETQKLKEGLLATILEGKDKPVYRCPKCGGQVRSKGKPPRKLKTKSGEVSFKRLRMRCIECGEDFSPSG